MLCGVFSILLAVSGRIDLAPFPIFLGAVFDFLDGFAARLLKQQGELGKQLDSLADVITFGLAPGIIMLVLLINSAHFSASFDPAAYKAGFDTWISELLNGKIPDFIPFTALIIPVFSMFRLAKFNIDTRQSTSFIGLPTPANTIFFAGYPLILCYTTASGNAFIHLLFHPYLIAAVIIIMSLLLISELPLFALKFKDFKWKNNQVRFTFLLLTLAAILTLKVWSIMVVILLYLLLSVVENYFYKKKQDEIQS